jgi:hypothetical protein
MLVTISFEASDREKLQKFLAGQLDSVTFDTAIEDDGELAAPDPATAAAPKKRGRKPKSAVEPTPTPTPVPAPAASPVPMVQQFAGAAPSGAVAPFAGFMPNMPGTPAAPAPAALPTVTALPGMMPNIPAAPVFAQPQAPAHPFDDPVNALNALESCTTTYNGQPTGSPEWAAMKGAVLDNGMFFGDLPASMSQCQTAEQRQRFIDRINRFDWLYTMQSSRGAPLAGKVRAMIESAAATFVASGNVFGIPDNQWADFKARCEQAVHTVQ